MVPKLVCIYKSAFMSYVLQITMNLDKKTGEHCFLIRN